MRPFSSGEWEEKMFLNNYTTAFEKNAIQIAALPNPSAALQTWRREVLTRISNVPLQRTICQHSNTWALHSGWQRVKVCFPTGVFPDFLNNSDDGHVLVVFRKAGVPPALREFCHTPLSTHFLAPIPAGIVKQGPSYLMYSMQLCHNVHGSTHTALCFQKSVRLLIVIKLLPKRLRFSQTIVS